MLRQLSEKSKRCFVKIFPLGNCLEVLVPKHREVSIANSQLLYALLTKSAYFLELFSVLEGASMICDSLESVVAILWTE